MTGVNPIKFSEYIVLNFVKSGAPITNLNLQKLLYYTQAWSLAYLNDHLFSEGPEAWVNGPVYVTVYHHYKRYGGANIEPGVADDKWDEAAERKWDELGLDADRKSLVASVIQVYGDKTPFELVYLTHSEDPWLEARKGLSPVEASNNPISFDIMRDYYRARITARQNAAAQAA